MYWFDMIKGSHIRIFGFADLISITILRDSLSFYGVIIVVLTLRGSRSVFRCEFSHMISIAA
jgi:hypothetical protein